MLCFDVSRFIRRCPYGSDFTQPALVKALSLIKQELIDSRETECFYDCLIAMAPTYEEKDILTSIRNTKREQRRMLSDIYKFYTCEEIVPVCPCKCIRPLSYVEGIRRALFEELDLINRLVTIREGLPIRCQRDMVYRMIIDSQNNVMKLNYILNLIAFRRNGIQPELRQETIPPYSAIETESSEIQ